MRISGTAPSSSPAETECPHGECDGSGLITRPRPGSFFGETHYCRCSTARRRQWLLRGAEVPERFREVRLSALDDRHPNALEAARRYARRWPAHEGQGLLFVGPAGVGKTTLAYGAFAACLDSGATGLAVNAADLLREFGRGLHDNRLDERLQAISEAELLLLDDVGAHRTASEWVTEQVYAIANARWSHQRPTIATSMTDPRQWGARDEQTREVWRAIASRLCGAAERFVLVGPDRRLEGGETA